MFMDTLKTFNVKQLASQLSQPFEMLNVAFVDDLIVSLYLCQGSLDWHRHPDNDELFWVHEGSIWLESEWGDLRLAAGEVALVPKGFGHRSRAVKKAIV